jgi:hypothetical protein
MREDFEDHARKILNSIKRSNPNTYDVEAIANYLAKNFGEGAGKEPAPVGRPRLEKPTGDLALTVAVFGDKETELGLRKGLADQYSVSKNTAKAWIEETREGLAEAEKLTKQIMADNKLSSLIRKRTAK